MRALDRLQSTATSASYVEGKNSFTCIEAGVITAVLPAEGQYDTTIVIVGSNLRTGADSVATVTLAGIEATITEKTNSEVILTVAHFRQHWR